MECSGSHYFIKWKGWREGATVVCNLTTMALLSCTKLPMLSQVKAVLNLSILYYKYAVPAITAPQNKIWSMHRVLHTFYSTVQYVIKTNTRQICIYVPVHCL
jgi:hypothetical protein